MKVVNCFILVFIGFALVACGGSSGSGESLNPGPPSTPDPETPDPETPDPETPDPTPGPISTELKTSGPHSTGTTQAPTSVYFDFDTDEVLQLTQEQAAENGAWDIAFRRVQITLNTNAATPVTAYFTGNNADFYDEAGAPIVETFRDATPDSELNDIADLGVEDVPSDDAFSTDVEELVIGEKFWNYDAVNHVLSAAAERYFVVQSDGNFTKFRVKDLVTSSRSTLSSLTLGVAFQAESDAEFAAEVDLVLDTAACNSDIYVDFDTSNTVEVGAEWDISLPCVAGEGADGAGFEINIADDASAFEATSDLSGIDPLGLAFYGFQPNLSFTPFFDDPLWYAYNLEGNNGIWSQFGVYLIRTATATYKFQILGYNDAEGRSGHYTFRYQALP